MEIKLSSREIGRFWEIPVLYEDEHLLAVNKPVGLAIGRVNNDPNQPNLIGLLHQGIAEAKPWASSRSLSFLMFAHRLDPDSGGVLLLAKNKDVLTKLSDFFGSERHGLSFITLVSGAPAETQFTIEAKIAPNATQPGLMQVSRKFGKRARTMFEIVERFSNWTLLRCAPLTYRLHQIRVHLARAGLRVVGDELYGGKPLWLSDLKPKYHLKPGHTEKPLLNRVCLYAERLDLVHPITNAPLTIDAPWPKDLLVALKYLRKFAPAATS